MQIVIDIPEKDYIYIAKKHCLPSCDDRTLRKNVYEMIANGTPLPKGHGALKDTDKIISDGINKGFCDWYDEIKYADTIIEADVPKRKEGTPLEENDNGYDCENWIP